MTEPYVKDFQTFAGNGAAGAPAWLREIRGGAIARFTALGFPTTKQEAWRFTSVAPIAATHFAPPASGVPPLALRDIAALSIIGTEGGPRIVFVDGRYAPGLSSLAGLPEGVQATSLAAATRAGPGGELARRHLARYAPWQDNAFAALNTAFLADGAFVHIAADTALAQPLEILFLATSGAGGGAADGPAVSHPRSLFVVERGARAALIESYASLADGVQWTNAVTETVVGEAARVELYRVQREGRNAYHIATTQSRQERDSYLGLHVLTLGGSLARHDITTVLDGTAAELLLNGLHVLAGS